MRFSVAAPQRSAMCPAIQEQELCHSAILSSLQLLHPSCRTTAGPNWKLEESRALWRMKITVIKIPADDQEQNQGSLVSNLSQLQAKGDGDGVPTNLKLSSTSFNDLDDPTSKG
jgi:hypothetical protein